MEHEVFVPFPAGRLREALADPVRVARAIPGLQQDASAVFESAADADAGSPPVSGTEPPVSGTGQGAAEMSSQARRERDAGAARVAGRLKVRVAGHTITYRGAFRVTAQDDGSYAVEGDATEVRGGGAVKLALTLRLLPADGGTTLAFGGTASGDGRVAELPHDAVSSAGQRLLTRFGETLTADLTTRADSVSGAESGHGAETQPEAEPGAASETEPEHATGAESGVGAETATGSGTESETATGTESETGTGTEAEAEVEAGTGPEPEVEAEPETEAEPEVGAGADSGAGADASSLSEADVPPSSPEPLAEDDEFDREDFGAEAGEPGRADPMAEAAHARRTMIGRSAEEVDHAPPRGRYAPVPPPEATAARDTLRWAAPAAALALASAIVVTRALRKRR
ncbi:carbon monoxide dehydrogenase [Streptomyces sp. NPDC006290]|uniref:carbon monoxide dehydrogenase n=1 Tax=Streptomyces sp. NPDC006290 TaxID=3156745 RepID=UPI0033A9ECF1